MDGRPTSPAPVPLSKPESAGKQGTPGKPPPRGTPVSDASSKQRRQRGAAALEAQRKRPLPPHVAMVRHEKRVAVLEAHPGQLVLRRAATAPPLVVPVESARRGRLVAGRIRLTLPDGSVVKARTYVDGERAPSELGVEDRTSFGGDGFDLGDDPISAVIAVVLVAVVLVLLPVVLVLWARRRHRRRVVAKRVLAAAAVPGRMPARPT